MMDLAQVFILNVHTLRHDIVNILCWRNLTFGFDFSCSFPQVPATGDWRGEVSVRSLKPQLNTCDPTAATALLLSPQIKHFY